MFNKKAISPVVATSLLLVVAVVSVVGFQSWYQTFSSNLFVSAEQDSGNLDTSGIEGIIGDTLYLKAGNNLTIESVQIDGNDCGINGTYSGTRGFDVSSCLENVSSSTPEVVMVTDDKVESKKVYLDDKTTQSISSLITNPLADLQCYNAPVNTIGSWEGCQDMLIVNLSMLNNAVANNNSINSGSDYYIEYGGINYTFGDSQYNIFTGQITNMNGLFEGTFIDKNKFNSDINYWDVNNVTSLYRTFRHTIDFNQPLDRWNTSSVTDLMSTFYYANSFNQPLNSWDTSNVETMVSMFDNALLFNQDLDNWDISSLNFDGLYGMFSGAASFNGDVSSWDTSNIESMYYLFSGTSFNSDISLWNTSNVVNMEGMFNRASNFNQPLNSLDTSNVTSIGAMFRHAISFNQPLNNWEVSNVNNMFGTFRNATSFNQDISMWETSNVGPMTRLFWDATSFNQNLSSWNTSSVNSCTNFDTNTLSWTLPKPNFSIVC